MTAQEKQDWEVRLANIRSLTGEEGIAAQLDVWSEAKKMYDTGDKAKMQDALTMILDLMEPIYGFLIAKAAHHVRPDKDLEDLRSELRIQTMDTFMNFDAERKCIGPTYIYTSLLNVCRDYKLNGIPKDIIAYQYNHATSSKTNSGKPSKRKPMVYITGVESMEAMMAADNARYGSGKSEMLEEQPEAFFKSDPTRFSGISTEAEATKLDLDLDSVRPELRSDPDFLAMLRVVATLETLGATYDDYLTLCDDVEAARHSSESSHSVQEAERRVERYKNFAKSLDPEKARQLRKNLRGPVLTAIDAYEKQKEIKAAEKTSRPKPGKGMTIPNADEEIEGKSKNEPR